MMSPEDKVAFKMVKKSIKHDGQQHEVANSMEEESRHLFIK